MNHYECGNLFGASKSLLEGSGLVRNCGDSFACNSDQEGLERWWSGSFDAEFGRYMAWVWFSVGAENLVKAALVCNGLLEEEKENPDYPIYWRDTDRESWVDEVLQCQENAGGGYGSLGRIWDVKLDKLSRKRGIPETEGRDLKAAYKYLAQAIRNRDAHSYKRNRRRRDFPAVEGVFVPAFNTLVRTMRDRGHFKANYQSDLASEDWCGA